MDPQEQVKDENRLLPAANDTLEDAKQVDNDVLLNIHLMSEEIASGAVSGAENRPVLEANRVQPLKVSFSYHFYAFALSVLKGLAGAPNPKCRNSKSGTCGRRISGVDCQRTLLAGQRIRPC